MDCYETTQGARVKLLLTSEELGLNAIDDLCNKYVEFISISKEAGTGRKTRSANKRADQLFDEIMAYKLPPIKPNNNNIQHPQWKNPPRSTNSSSESESGSSIRPITRSLRSRSRTPEVQPKRQISPSTPQHQRLRAHINLKPASGSGDQTPSVLTAALNQQHPTVSVTKIRQLLRADSVQKKKIRDDEEKERQERLRLDRKAKEERAESQKKQLLEERAVNAKLKREQRLLHAAEVRKAREEAKLRQEAEKQQKQVPVVEKVEEQPPQENKQENKQEVKQETKKAKEKANETFQKNVEEINNIEILINDDSAAEVNKVVQIASWTKAPHFREALIKQFSKDNFQDYLKRFMDSAPQLMLPVDLKEILGPKSLGSRALVRTSSAVWSPVHKPLKRSSSMISTPVRTSKR